MFSFVLAKAPYRISFFGGGTDYPAWYRENPGAVLVTSIDKYCYILCRRLPPFFEEKNRVVWSQIELTQAVDEIRHPAVREALKTMVMDGVEIHHAGDLPARAGMGTSSAFTVALVHALHALNCHELHKMQLALEAIRIEQDMIKENVGSQDQTISAFGGFNRIDFNREHEIDVTPVHSLRLNELEASLLLFFTGFSRTASKLAEAQIDNMHKNKSILLEMYALVDEGVKILTSESELAEFGRLLGETWKMKRRLAGNVTTDYIDYIYSNAISAGAIGGKLLGAGGGGFILFYVEPETQPSVKERLSSLLHVPFKFEARGSQIIFSGG